MNFCRFYLTRKDPSAIPSSDNDRTMITDATEDLLLVYYAFDGAEDLPALLSEAKDLLEKYAGGREFETEILI